MKFAVAVLACLAVASAQYRPTPFSYSTQRPQYRPYTAFTTAAPYRPYQPYSTPAPVVPYVSATQAPVVVPVAKVVSDARNAETLKYINEVYPDGSYNYVYETQNGIAAQEQGTPRDFGGNPPVRPDVKQGSFSWTSPEGIPIVITYVADEEGYKPQGNAIPTPPPLPPQIARALEYTAKYLVPQKK